MTYYDNDLNDPIWLYTARTKAGAYRHAKTLKEKLGVTILEHPMERHDELWVIMFTNPFMKVELSSLPE